MMFHLKKKYRKKTIFFTYYWQQKLFLWTTVKRRRTACGFGPPQHYCSHFKMVCGAPRLHLTACYALHVPVSEASSPWTELGIVRTHPRPAFSDPLRRLKSILEGGLTENVQMWREFPGEAPCIGNTVSHKCVLAFTKKGWVDAVKGLWQLCSL